MIFGILLLVIIFIIYILLVKGALWKLIVHAAAYFGLYVALTRYLPSSKNMLLTIDNNQISWAVVVPIIIIILSLAYTHE